MAYRIEYSQSAVIHLRALTARQQATVLAAVRRQLEHEPTTETRNRKPMRSHSIAPWELRIGNLRVYYAVEDVPEQVVRIQAVGIKERDRVRIGGKDVEL